MPVAITSQKLHISFIFRLFGVDETNIYLFKLQTWQSKRKAPLIKHAVVFQVLSENYLTSFYDGQEILTRWMLLNHHLPETKKKYKIRFYVDISTHEI